MGIHTKIPVFFRHYPFPYKKTTRRPPRIILLIHCFMLSLLPASCITFEPGPIPAPFADQPETAATSSLPLPTIARPLSAVTSQQTPFQLSTQTPATLPDYGPPPSIANPGGTYAYRRITTETLTFTIPKGWSSCANIAAYFGITLDALYTTNPEIHQYGRCVIHTGQVLTIPPVEVLTPDVYVSRYECIPSGTKVCLQPDDPLEVMVAHTLFGEGGSSMGPASAANILQVALNRLNNLLEHRGVAVPDLSREEFQQLLIHFLAQPYKGSSEEHPAFNAFAMPCSHPQDPEQFQGGSINNWNASLEIARNALENGRDPQWWSGAYQPDPRIIDPANQVLYYCSGPSSNPPFDTSEYARIVAVEERNANTLRSQWYYYNSSQHCSW
ncbi:MAG: LysM peptidoglycan-binding domain-containing protein [Anaerolineales bacterium]|nr:LysM peptidoglycan-binding domain-containing protein [Anaerolineales bacterium]